MERELKSIAHAAIANGVQIYIPTGNKNYIIGSRLVCAECNEPWYMNLTECFLCGAINPFLYRCDNCGAFSSITKASDRCDSCGEQGTLHQECPNPDCVSNTNKSVKKAINSMGGVFNKYSGFRISSQRCLNCGSQFHLYQVRRIIVFSVCSEMIDKSKLHIDDPEVLSKYSYIIFRILKNGEIKYSFLPLSEYARKENVFSITQVYDNFGEVIKEIFNKERD